MKVYSLVALGMMGTMWFCPVSAADLKSATLKDGRIVVSISGDITEGDSDALKGSYQGR
jgi:hypothetical protein